MKYLDYFHYVLSRNRLKGIYTTTQNNLNAYHITYEEMQVLEGNT